MLNRSHRHAIKTKQNKFHFRLFSFQTHLFLFQNENHLHPNAQKDDPVPNWKNKVGQVVIATHYATNTIVTNNNIPQYTNFQFVWIIGRSEITNCIHIYRNFDCIYICTVTFISISVFLWNPRWWLSDWGKNIQPFLFLF